MSVPSNTPQHHRAPRGSVLKTIVGVLQTWSMASMKRCQDAVSTIADVVRVSSAKSSKGYWSAIGTVAGVLRTWLAVHRDKLIKFFGVIGSITIVALLLSGFILYWTWQHEELRPIVSAIAGGLGVLLGAIAALIEDKGEKSARWILAISAGVFTGWFAWYTTSDLTDQLKEKTELAELGETRVRLLRDDIVKYVRPLRVDEYRRVLTQAGFDNLRGRFNEAITKHRPPFRSIEFESSRDIIYIIRQLEGENKNGHALYIQGEIERFLGLPDRGNQRFYTYLEVENLKTRTGELGALPCQNPEGVCRERTAWVFNLLARNLLQQGRDLKAAGRPEAQYREVFSEALKHACSAIKLFPDNGFTQPPPTRALEKALSDELGKGATRTPKAGECLWPE